MRDLIERQAAIRKLKIMATKAYIDKLNGSAEIVINCCIDVIERQIPSAQPEPLVKESRTLVKDLVKDTISRQATIDALVKAIRKDPYYDTIMRAERRTDAD